MAARPAERHQELQVLVAEGVRGGEVVHVEQAEHLVLGVEQGRAHGAPHALHHDRAPLEPGVGRHVVRHDRDPLLGHLVGDGAGHRLELGVALAAPAHRGDQLAGVVPQQDGDPVHRHHLEGHVRHPAEQPVEVQLRRELLGHLEQEGELPRLALRRRRGVHPELPRRRAVPAGDAGRHPAAHHQLPDDLPAAGPWSGWSGGCWRGAGWWGAG